MSNTYQKIIRAHKLIDLNRLDDAISLAQECLSDPVYTATAYSIISDCHGNHENWKDAKQAIELALELEPEEIDYLDQYGLILINLGDLRKSKKILHQSLEIEPEGFRSRYYLAQVYINQRNYTNANALIRELKSEYPNNEDIQLLESKNAMLSQNFHKSNKIAEHVLSENPENLDALIHKGINLFHRNKFKEAKNLMYQVLALDPMNSDAKSILLQCRQNENSLMRFFIGNAFSTYYMEWTVGRVIMAIIFFKGFIFWGFLLAFYMLVTWIGGVLYLTYLRTRERDKLLLNQRQIWQSNYLIIHLIVILNFCIYLNLFDSELLSKVVVLTGLSAFIGISYFELETKSIKINWWIVVGFIALLLGLAFMPFDAFWLGMFAYFLLLIHGVLFSFRVIGE